MSKQGAFQAADILLPMDCGLTRWAVVACDQYTSQPEYWQRVADFVGDAPSTLHLILPESKLEGEQVAADIEKIHKTMEEYSQNKRFRTVEHSFLYLERRLHNGTLRRGLLGQVDLEQYSYDKGSQTPIRATEGTVLSRIPPRMAVRRDAAIELPHILILIDDPDKTVVEPLAAQKGEMPLNYVCELMENGGQISAWTLSDAQKDGVMQALSQLADPQRFEMHYQAQGKAPLVYAVGDGNHSLATAKACWEELKKTLPASVHESHPARFALVELGNLHDESLAFEAIHRVVFDVDADKLLEQLLAFYPGAHRGVGEGHSFRVVYGTKEETITVPQPEAQLAVGTLQHFLDDYLERAGGKIDYIHGEDVVRTLSATPNSIGFLLPCMQKDELFPTVIFDGALPRKTFSMGEAHDKRFYLEARKIK